MDWFFNRSPQTPTSLTSGKADGGKTRKGKFDSRTDLATTNPGEVLTGQYTISLKGEDIFAQHDCSIKSDHLSMVMVADGHGGAQTAVWLKEHLLPKIEDLAEDGSGAALHRACTDAFAFAHQEVHGLTSTLAKLGTGTGAGTGPDSSGATAGDGSEPSSARNCSGATCTVCIFNHHRREVTCANVGDSEALLLSELGVEPLSTSHRLQNSPEEQSRLRAEGVQLARAADAHGAPTGPLRAWPGGLAVTRGLGDADCQTVVSCVPAVRTVAAPDGGGVVVVCSDGVWDTLGAGELAKLFVPGASRFSSARHCAKKVVRRAIGRSGTIIDDTTCVALWLDATDAVGVDGSFLTKRIKARGLETMRLAAAVAGGREAAYMQQKVEKQKHRSQRVTTGNVDALDESKLGKPHEPGSFSQHSHDASAAGDDDESKESSNHSGNAFAEIYGNGANGGNGNGGGNGGGSGGGSGGGQWRPPVSPSGHSVLSSALNANGGESVKMMRPPARRQDSVKSVLSESGVEAATFLLPVFSSVTSPSPSPAGGEARVVVSQPLPPANDTFKLSKTEEEHVRTRQTPSTPTLPPHAARVSPRTTFVSHPPPPLLVPRAC